MHTGSDRKLSRYAINVLTYSAPARRWPTSLAIQYHVHNSAGIKVVNVPALQIVQNYAHANNSGPEPCRSAFNLRCY